MKLIPIPTPDVGKVVPLIQPFLPSIAKRGRVSTSLLWQEIESGETQVHLVWCDQTKTTKALVGTRIILRGNSRIGELAWCTGQDRVDWFDLITQLEDYMRHHLGCEGIKAVCRPGWKRELQANGYRLTHLIMEKDF